MAIELGTKRPTAKVSARQYARVMSDVQTGKSRTVGVNRGRLENDLNLAHVAQQQNKRIGGGSVNHLLNRPFVEALLGFLPLAEVEAMAEDLAQGRRISWSEPFWRIATAWEIRTSRVKVDYEDAQQFRVITAVDAPRTIDVPDPMAVRYWVTPGFRFGRGVPFMLDFAPRDSIGAIDIFGKFPDRPIFIVARITDQDIFGLVPDRPIRRLISIPDQDIFGQTPDRAIRKVGAVADEDIFGERPDRPILKTGNVVDQDIFSEFPDRPNTNFPGGRPIRKIGNIPDIDIFGKPPDRPIRLR